MTEKNETSSMASDNESGEWCGDRYDGGYWSDDMECSDCDGRMSMGYYNGYRYWCEKCKLLLMTCNSCLQFFEEEEDSHLYVKHPHYNRPFINRYINCNKSILCIKCHENHGFSDFHIDKEYKSCPQCSKDIIPEYDHTSAKCMYYECKDCNLCLVSCKNCNKEMEFNDDRHLFTIDIYIERCGDDDSRTYLSPICMQCAGSSEIKITVWPNSDSENSVCSD